MDKEDLRRLMQVAYAKSADRASAELFSMDRDDSPEQSRERTTAPTANEAAASSSNEPKVFYPSLATKRRRRGENLRRTSY